LPEWYRRITFSGQLAADAGAQYLYAFCPLHVYRYRATDLREPVFSARWPELVGGAREMTK
jgi:hypothetical protein